MNTEYHYTQSGLDNVFLENGFSMLESPYGQGVSIEDVDRLHECIGSALCSKPGPLTGKEFRFLRLELDLSQRRVGELMGKDQQSVLRWEGSEAVAEGHDYLMRHIYAKNIVGESDYVDLVDKLRELDVEDHQKNMMFQETEGEWRVA